MSEKEKEKEKEAETESRSHRRVSVGLSATVVLSREEVYLAQTVDMSEGGIRLEQYFGPQLKEGRLIGVNVHGIVTGSDDGSTEESFLMRVVRCAEDQLALHFVAD